MTKSRDRLNTIHKISVGELICLTFCVKLRRGVQQSQLQQRLAAAAARVNHAVKTVEFIVVSQGSHNMVSYKSRLQHISRYNFVNNLLSSFWYSNPNQWNVLHVYQCSILYLQQRAVLPSTSETTLHTTLSATTHWL